MSWLFTSVPLRHQWMLALVLPFTRSCLLIPCYIYDTWKIRECVFHLQGIGGCYSDSAGRAGKYCQDSLTCPAASHQSTYETRTIYNQLSKRNFQKISQSTPKRDSLVYRRLPFCARVFCIHVYVCFPLSHYSRKHFYHAWTGLMIHPKNESNFVHCKRK